MADYRKMFDDKEHFYAFDLDGRERTLEIERVTAGELTGDKNRKTKKPMISFVGEKKKLAVNKTNGKTIASLYGTDADRWAGQLITIFPTTTDFGGQTVDCIRVRPQRPDRPQRATRSSAPPQQAAARDSATIADRLVERLAECRDAATYRALEAERGEAWKGLSKDDKLRVKDAVAEAGIRVADAERDAEEARRAWLASLPPMPSSWMASSDDREEAFNEWAELTDEERAAEIALADAEKPRGQ